MLTPEQQQRVESLQGVAEDAAKHLASRLRGRTLIAMGRTTADDLKLQACLILCEEVAKGNPTDGGLLYHRIKTRLGDYMKGLSGGPRLVGDEGLDNRPPDEERESDFAQRIVSILSDDERSIALAIAAQNLTPEEVASQRGVSVKTIHRAMSKITKKLTAATGFQPRQRRSTGRPNRKIRAIIDALNKALASLPYPWSGQKPSDGI